MRLCLSHWTITATPPPLDENSRQEGGLSRRKPDCQRDIGYSSSSGVGAEERVGRTFPPFRSVASSLRSLECCCCNHYYCCPHSLARWLSLSHDGISSWSSLQGRCCRCERDGGEQEATGRRVQEVELRSEHQRRRLGCRVLELGQVCTAAAQRRRMTPFASGSLSLSATQCCGGARDAACSLWAAPTKSFACTRRPTMTPPRTSTNATATSCASPPR